uniref:Uncharacterized protein n=1 Tax=Acrobeloides nanus TaxID=290746 RepID=A0A914CZ59_9BILA
MNNLVNPPSVNDLLDQGFDLQYFNPPTEYPVKLEDDWYLKFIKGPIKVTNSPIVPNKKDSAAKTTTTEEHVRTSSPLKDRNQQSSSKAPTSTPPTNHSQEKPKSKKGPTVTEIDDDGNLPSISPSPIPDLKTEIMQQVQNEVAKEILTKHKAEVEEGIQKRVAAHVLKQVPQGYMYLQSVEFNEAEYLEKEEKRRQKERERAHKAANDHRRKSWK